MTNRIAPSEAREIAAAAGVQRLAREQAGLEDELDDIYRKIRMAARYERTDLVVTVLTSLAADRLRSEGYYVAGNDDLGVQWFISWA